MAVELVFLERRQDESAVILFTKAPDLVGAHQAYLASSHPIQQRMRALAAEAFDPGRPTVLEVLLDVGSILPHP